MKTPVYFKIFAIALSLFTGRQSYGQCMSPVSDPGFERQSNSSKLTLPWMLVGSGGVNLVDHPTKTIKNTVRLAAAAGWSDVRQMVTLTGGKRYTLIVEIRGSENGPEGQIGFRNSKGRSLNLKNFVAQGAFNDYSLSYTPKTTGRYIIFAGFKAANNDDWINIRNMDLRFPCGDVNLVPVKD